MIQVPYVGRAKIEETSEALLIRIPSAKNWFVLAFLPIWLCGWGVGWFMASKSLVTGNFQMVNFTTTLPPRLFLVVWLIFWTAGGFYAAYMWLRTLSGIEVLEINADSISTGLRVIGYERGRSFDQKHIWRLRIVPIPAPSIFENRTNQWWGSPTLAFDYGARTIRFGSGIDEAEAQQLLERIQKKFPQYAPRESTAWENLGGHRP